MISTYINKTVSFRYSKENLSFHLSHGLFSSHGVDSGSMFLLKIIAAKINPAGVKSILDIGSGTGIIGISLKKKNPEAALTMVDRDALALAFSRENSSLNGIDDGSVTYKPGLMFFDDNKQNQPRKGYDLIVSNLPAKAGALVLDEFFKNSILSLNKGGSAGVVIVNTLGDTAEKAINKYNGKITFSESTKEHRVFIYGTGEKKTGGNPEKDFLAPYIRLKKEFSRKKISYTLETVYNLPDFDVAGYALNTALDILNGLTLKGDLLFWEPGQGHIPVCLSKKEKRISSCTLAGRDFLSLKISERNLAEKNIRHSTIFVPDFPFIQGLIEPESFDGAVISFYPIPGVNKDREIYKTAIYTLKKDGILVLYGKSSSLYRFIKGNPGLKIINTKKHRGFRCIALKKPGKA